jgi:glycosyltransferase involved in cell wall biosynthesis
LPKSLGAILHDKFTSIYSTVDAERFTPVPGEAQVRLRRELNIDGKPLLTYVASFHPKKAQLPFIEQVLPALVEHHPDVTVAFVGDFQPNENDRARACEEAVDRLGLRDHVRFTGYQSGVEQWYQAADLNILASKKEGLARSMIESLACGTPVVSFDVASAREILEEHDCGRVVPQGDYEQLREAIVKLWQNDSLREEMGQRGAEAARELFDSKKITRQYRRLYNDISL